MALKTLLWVGFFAFASVAAFWSPIWGVIGYIMEYIISPKGQWWDRPLRPLGLRYSFTLAACTAVGIGLNWERLRFGTSLLHRNEKWMLLFLGIIWILAIISAASVGRYATAGKDHPSVKMTKILLFVFMMTHVVTDAKKLNLIYWALVIGALIMGFKAYSTPMSAFTAGRLETVGGADFHDANYFAAFMAGMLFIIGAQFMRSGWLGKVVCFLAGGFTANAIVLTQSRGAFLGVSVGCLVLVLLAPKRYRIMVFGGLLLAGFGGFYLSSTQFLSRMGTIAVSEDERGGAVSSRIDVWKGTVKMVLANPQGVGPGNFYQNIGRYEPKRAGMDAHNTYLRCAGELGVLGLASFLIVVISPFLLLRRTMKTAAMLPDEVGVPILWAAFGAMSGLAAVLADGMTQTFVYTEFLWWMLAIPVCVSRTLDNLVDEYTLSDADDDSSSEEEEEDVVVEAAL